MTKKEQAGLRELANGLQKKEIVKEIPDMTICTVENAVKSIYKKLDINSRKAACQKAQELGLI